MRPIITNGIEESLTRSDLLDRAITLTLPAISDDARLEEDDVWQRFDVARPRILGALLTAVSSALRNKAGVRLASKPRMADFATWIVAAEPALDWPAGAFLSAYTANREGANAVALDSSAVAQPILALVEKYGTWRGTVKQLLAELEDIADEKTRKGRDWPTGPRKLGGELRRLAPPLRRAGINLTFHERSRAGVPVTLERAGASPSQHTQSTPNPPGAGPDGERREHCERDPQPDSANAGQPDEVFEWTA